MGRPVFTNSDAVVGGDVNLLEVLECGHTYSGSAIQVEDKVCARHRDKCSFVEGCKSVGYGAHGMLANTIVDISTTVVSAKATNSLKVRLGFTLVTGLRLRKKSEH